ncbi:hypothetical protein ACFFMN_26345 [Planobispora siamensis]|uniref:Uncharacterized protein n=1 Tax=Planobispora siamensis TaxID=936338 RepID=A0A8J3WHN7_9ACTN|nr:hypothetical protein [Planobispora siamensis]GIH90814.1 hypothetical protein Psi01_14440 [Planobispora siamensis]
MTTTKTPAPAAAAAKPAPSGAVPAAVPPAPAPAASSETAEMPAALAAMMTEDEAVAAQAEAARWRYGFYVVLTGLIVILVGFVVIALQDGEGSAPFAGLVGVSGAIIGAYFGVQVGQSGKARVEAELRRANEMAIRLAAKIHAHDADAVINSTMGTRRR